MPIQEKCRILDHQKLSPKYLKLILSSAYISSHAEPGQFINVRCGEGYEPLLRRPFSLHRISKEHKTFELLYEIVGEGTERLSRYTVGGEIDVLGPLGEGFKIDPKKQIAVLAGGGMGVAPLLALAEQIAQDKLLTTHTYALYIMIGGKNRDCVLCEEDFRKVSDQVLTATDDGSYGKKGLITDLLLDFLDNQLPTSNFQKTTIYACGPKAMLRAISEIAYQKRIDCQISTEEHMACGIGACKGCPTKTKSGLKMVCKDGPVFDAKEIIWE